MNVTKKVIAFITVVLLAIRIFVINVSASFAAPFMAEETLKLLFIEVLGSTGSYSADDLESWEYDDLRNEFDIQMTTNPNFNAKKVIPPLISGDMSDVHGSPENIAKLEEEKKKYREIIGNVVSDWFNSMYENGSDLYDFIHPTYTDTGDTVDLKGGTCGAYIYDKDGKLIRKYIGASNGVIIIDNLGRATYDVQSCIYTWKLKPVESETFHTPEDNYARHFSVNVDQTFKLFGDWRYEDDTQFENDDEVIPVIGEAGETQVTPDMLNPDGTVTIDGTTYYPKDFIDWDKFKDPAIIDLLNKILSKIDDVDVIEPDNTKDLVDSITDSVDISVPDELSDYMVPTGISSVFPFCLPFDLYRGIKLLSAKPVAPVLEIPFEVPEFGFFKGYKTTLKIEFEKYDKYFSVFRWGTYLMFAFGLIFITTKIVKGANE